MPEAMAKDATKAVDEASKKESPKKAGAAAVDPKEVEKKKEKLEFLIKKSPSGIQKYLLEHIDKLVKFQMWFEHSAIPFMYIMLEYVINLYHKVQPYYYDTKMVHLFPAAAGLFLCFFGGTFPLLIASIEAFRICGYTGMWEALCELKEESDKALEANKKDDQEDLDGDGIPDAEQIPTQELMARKTKLLLRVVKPEKVTRAITALNTGLLAVLANLKMTFARAVTLGASIAEIMNTQANKRVVPYLRSAVQEEYQQWIEPAVSYLCKAIAVSFAFFLQRIISAFWSAMKGGEMLGVGLVRFAHAMGWIQFDEKDSYLDETVGFVFAALGFMFQFSSGFALFFPLNLVLMPMSMGETFLEVSVTYF